MTILTSVTEIEDRIVEGVRDIQRPVVDYVRKSVEQAEGRIPKLSYPKVSFPKVNYPKVSYPEGFPTRAEVTEVVETQIAFAKALFETQRAFVTDLFDAVSPLVETSTQTGADEPVVAATPAAAASDTAPAARKPAKTTKAKSTRATKATPSTKA